MNSLRFWRKMYFFNNIVVASTLTYLPNGDNQIRQFVLINQNCLQKNRSRQNVRGGKLHK